MVTIYDIARHANVSAMTVSRVMNNTGRISDKTRARVKKVMEELNYVPNSMARSLVLQETKILSLLITDITNPFYTTVARGAEDAAMEYGYRLLFSNSDENVGKEREYVDMVLSTRVDGVLFAPAGDGSLDHLNKLRGHKIPFVLLDRDVPGISSDSVLGDSKEGARKLVEHLISFGHRRIALLNGQIQVSTARERYAGYREALQAADIRFSRKLVEEISYRRFDEQVAAEILERLLGQERPPTAIFAANNFLAVGAIRALRSRGLRVPDDISVVCFDDLEFAAILDPFLTVVSQPAYEFGYLGIRLLIERIQDTHNSPWKRVILPSELIVRKSAAPIR